VDNTNFPVVYYRMPNEKNVHFIQSKSSPLEIGSLKSLPRIQGFIFYPFTVGGSCKPLFIVADERANLAIEDVINDTPAWKIKTTSSLSGHCKNEEEYSKMIEGAIKEISSGDLQKVVLTRLKNITAGTGKNPLKVFYKLCTEHPSAFVSLVYIPGSVLWITASPELLISANGNDIKTVSLAGTKPAENIDNWGEKEKMEQQVVTDYIKEILKKYCENITVSGPHEIIAGNNIKHLKTSFSATLNTDLWSLVSALHPTPAVCGIPLDASQRFIVQTEGYDRKYYTGFLGPCNMGGGTNLFVNLRCAEIFANSVNLYVGGGITKDSVPEKEWEETELKSKTLIFAFDEDEE
jgi:isochorismate synthase